MGEVGNFVGSQGHLYLYSQTTNLNRFEPFQNSKKIKFDLMTKLVYCWTFFLKQYIVGFACFFSTLLSCLVVTGPGQDQLKDPTQKRFFLSLWSSERCNSCCISKKKKKERSLP
jgi:hypothetical protein